MIIIRIFIIIVECHKVFLDRCCRSVLRIGSLFFSLVIFFTVHTGLCKCGILLRQGNGGGGMVRVKQVSNM